MPIMTNQHEDWRFWNINMQLLKNQYSDFGKSIFSFMGTVPMNNNGLKPMQNCYWHNMIFSKPIFFYYNWTKLHFHSLSKKQVAWLPYLTGIQTDLGLNSKGAMILGYIKLNRIFQNLGDLMNLGDFRK